ncbi:MAG: hypothetical protein CVU01_00130 [Bacteroidetes bacterium HGW-Bacteroidetes-18]|nr:MAG: hypothetical protein CVU01_00130 [Bacteroidetes bacterium HGW-Bacteroidetes-18]
MNNKFKGICFGEILFDVILWYKKIDGAPINVVSRMKSLGDEISIISAFGRNSNGRELIECIKNLGINIKTGQE